MKDNIIIDDDDCVLIMQKLLEIMKEKTNFKNE